MNKMATTKPLNVGLIVDSNFVSKHVYDLAEWALEQTNIQVSYLIIQEHNIVTKSKIARAMILLKTVGFSQLFQKSIFRIIAAFEDAVASRYLRNRDHVKILDISKLVNDSVTVRPLVSSRGIVYRYDTGAIEKIKALELDLLIRCGSGILKGEILNIAKYGILSFHHGDSAVNRGGPAGFWEVYGRHNTTGFIIQQLTEELDGGNVLVKGTFTTRSFFGLNRAVILSRSNLYMKRLLSKIAAERVLPPTIDPKPYFNRLYKMPSVAQQLHYILIVASSMCNKIVNVLILKRRHRWGVAFQRKRWKNIVMWRANIIKRPPNHFLADPFLITEDGRDFCFVEDYDYKLRKGCIAVYRFNDNDAERVGEAIVEPFHMSFPYLFRYESRLYMCPETHKNNDIRLYECVKFPLEWKLSKVLMHSVSAADTMIFEYGGLWWLFTNIDPLGTGYHCAELCIFYAENPLKEIWTPHPGNPVVLDSSKGRNAGLIIDDSGVYRVSQKQGFDLYGEGFCINKILVLNEHEYVEDVYCSVEPAFFPNIIGTHHLHCSGDITVFDYLECARIDR